MKMSEAFILPVETSDGVDQALICKCKELLLIDGQAMAAAHAINCHDELVAALELAYKLIYEWRQDSEEMPSNLDIAPIEVALLKARG